MAADFTYDSDNDLVTCCNGTVQSPKTFAHMHDWDIANAATLLTADTPAANMSLDYAVRPCEMGALKLDVILTGCTLGGGDTVDLTGTDSEGDALTETIDVSGGNGTYTTTKSFASIDASGVDCNGFNDGTIRIDQPRQGVVWEIVEDYQYRVTPRVFFGDGSTSSVFMSHTQSVHFDQRSQIQSNCTVNIGLLLATSYPLKRTYWCMSDEASGDEFLSGGTLLCYGSMIDVRASNGYLNFVSGTVDFQDSVIFNSTRVKFYIGLDSFKYDDLTIGGFNGTEVSINKTPDSASDKLFIHRSSLLISNKPTASIKGYKYADQAGVQFQAIGGDYNSVIIDPQTLVTNAATASNDINQKFTCNLHIVDEDGANLTGVTVKCYNWNGGSYALDWTASTGANGRLTSTEYVKHDYWTYSQSGGPTTTYYPHKFEFTKSGYVGLALENVSIAEKMEPDWRIEMSLSNSDLVSAVETALGNKKVDTAAKVLVNKAVQNKSTGAVDYYNDAGSVVVLTHTPLDDGTDITRTPS